MSAQRDPKIVSGKNTFVWISLLLAPCVCGIVCALYDSVDRGGAWWLLAGLAVPPAILGLLAAVVTAIVQGVRRRLAGSFLVAACIEVVIIAAA